MKQFFAGIILGSVLTGSLGLAGNFYNKEGGVQAPRGSIESFDYFRSRQQLLDIGALRRNQEEQLRTNPCGR